MDGVGASICGRAAGRPRPSRYPEATSHEPHDASRAWPRSAGAAGFACGGALLALLLSLALPLAAQPGRAAVPENATARSYGSGWTCNRGYTQAGDACAPVAVPANGFLSPFGNDWECDRLYRKRVPHAWRS